MITKEQWDENYAEAIKKITQGINSPQHIKTEKTLLDFCNSSDGSITLEGNGKYRKYVHERCSQLGLGHKSDNYNRVVVSKHMNWTFGPPKNFIRRECGFELICANCGSEEGYFQVGWEVSEGVFCQKCINEDEELNGLDWFPLDQSREYENNKYWDRLLR